jgi:hypothetical protein
MEGGASGMAGGASALAEDDGFHVEPTDEEVKDNPQEMAEFFGALEQLQSGAGLPKVLTQEGHIACMSVNKTKGGVPKLLGAWYVGILYHIAANRLMGDAISLGTYPSESHIPPDSLSYRECLIIKLDRDSKEYLVQILQGIINKYYSTLHPPKSAPTLTWDKLARMAKGKSKRECEQGGLEFTEATGKIWWDINRGGAQYKNGTDATIRTYVEYAHRGYTTLHEQVQAEFSAKGLDLTLVANEIIATDVMAAMAS